MQRGLRVGPIHRRRGVRAALAAAIVWSAPAVPGAALAQSELLFAPLGRLAPTDAAQSPSIASDGGGGFRVVWSSTDSLGDTIGDDSDILVSRSADGVSWSAPNALNTDAAGDAVGYVDPKLATDGDGTWVAAWGGTRAGLGEFFHVYVSRSVDSGATWSAPSPLAPALCASLVCSDVRLATDGHGAWVAAWSGSASIPFKPDRRAFTFHVARSGDGGATWSTPLTLGAPMERVDSVRLRPSVAAAGPGRFVVAFEGDAEQADATGTDSDIFYVRSGDAGQSWSDPLPLASDASEIEAQEQLPSVAGDAGGTLVAVWRVGYSAAAPWLSDGDIRVARSIDAGATWSETSQLNDDAVRDGQIADSAPVVATDGAGTWSVVFSRFPDRMWPSSYDVNLASVVSTDGGATWGSPAPVGPGGPPIPSPAPGWPDLATDAAGTWVVTSLHQGASDPRDNEILVATAHGPASVIDSDGDGIADSTEPWFHATDPFDADSDHDALDDLDELIARTDPLAPDSDDDGVLDGVEVHVHRSDPTHPDSDGDLYGDGEEVAAGSDPTSADSIPSTGLAFTPPLELNANAAIDGDGRDEDAQIAVDAAGVAIAVWSSSSDGGSPYGIDADILYARSTDFGATWSEPRAINSYAAVDANQSSDLVPRVTTDGAGTYVVVWGSSHPLAGGVGGDFDVFFSRSTDAGQTWSPAAPISDRAQTDSGWDSVPVIETDRAGGWLCAWRSNDTLSGTLGTDWDHLYVRSIDGGATWSDTRPLVERSGHDTAQDQGIALATDRLGHWVAVWTSNDDLDGTIGTDEDVLVARSIDGGATFTDPVALNSDAATDDRRDGASFVATDGAGRWVAAWHDPTLDFVYVATSDDAGATWSDLRIVDPAWGDTDSASFVAGGIATDRAGNWAIAYGGSLGLFVNSPYGRDHEAAWLRSIDGGDSWLAPVPINTDAVVDDRRDSDVRLTTDEAGHWFAVWKTYAFSPDSGSDPEVAFSTAFGPDADGDGLADGAEVNVHGTDPDHPDTDGDGASDGEEIAAGTDPLVPSALVVAIDISPHSADNRIRFGPGAVVRVAVLGSVGFDVTTIDPGTLRFGEAAPIAGRGGWKRRAGARDVDGDGILDLVSHHRVRETGIAPGDVEACVTGETLDGKPIRGCDVVTTEPVCGSWFETAAVVPAWAVCRRRRRNAGP